MDSKTVKEERKTKKKKDATAQGSSDTNNVEEGDTVTANANSNEDDESDKAKGNAPKVKVIKPEVESGDTAVADAIAKEVKKMSVDKTSMSTANFLINPTLHTTVKGVDDVAYDKPPTMIIYPDDIKLDPLQPEISPFSVLSEIPSLYEFSTISTTTYDTPQVMNPKILTDIPQVQRSYELFNESTMVTYVKIRDTLCGTALANINEVNDKIVTVSAIGKGLANYQDIMNVMTNRLVLLTQILLSTMNVLYEIPTKIVPENNVKHGKIANHLAKSTFWVGDHPHPYLAAIQNKIAWFRRDLENKFSQPGGGLILSETHVVSKESKKVSSTVTAVVDQDIAMITRLEFDRWNSRQLTAHAMQLFLQAPMFEGDQAIVQTNQDQISLLYHPQPYEFQLFMITVFTNFTVKAHILQHELRKVEATGYFSMAPIDSVINPSNIPSDPNGRAFMDAVNQKLKINKDASFASYLTYETYASFIDFKLAPVEIPVDAVVPWFILSILTQFVVFPQTSQRMLPALGFRLMSYLEVYIPTHMNDFKRAYGTIRFRGANTNITGIQMTTDESITGYVYSIFDNLPAAPNVNAQFRRIMARIRDLCLPRRYEHALNNKRVAGFPYYRQDYIAYTSWSYIPQNDAQALDETTTVQRLNEAYNIISTLIEFRERGREATPSLSRPTSSVINNALNDQRRLIKSSGLLFDVSAARMQRALQNGPLFVYQGFQPEVMIHAQKIVQQPTDNGLHQQGIPLQELKVTGYDMFAALRFALTVSGHFERNITYSTQLKDDLSLNGVRVQRQFEPIDGTSDFYFLMTMMKQSRKEGFIKEMIQNLTDTRDPDNPIIAANRLLRPILKMSNWGPLVTKLLSLADLKFNTFFTDVWSQHSGAYDGRTINFVLNLLDRENRFPMANPPQGTIFGTRHERVDAPTRASTALISRRIFSPNSQFNMIKTGLYIGRAAVDELSPYRPDAENGWELIAEDNYTFVHLESKGGYAVALAITRGDDVTQYILGINDTMPNIMLEMTDFSKIRHYTTQIAQAIMWGNLALKVTSAKVQVSVTYVPSRKTDYSLEMTQDMIISLISSPVYAILPIMCMDTTHATQFTLNASVTSKYVQWVSLFDTADSNIVAAAIVDAIEMPPQSIMPSVQTMGYGYYNNNAPLLDPVTHLPKTDSDVINFNNGYPAISKDIVLASSNIKIEIRPQVPVMLIH